MARAWRWFDYFQAGALRQRNGGDAGAQVKCDGMAGAIALALGRQVERHIAHLALCAKEGVPHQAVEIERRSGAGMGLRRSHFLELQSLARNRLGDRVGGLHGGALRHVDHD